MSDPRVIGPQQRLTNHSPLMKALTSRKTGDVVNFCPYGCENHELDENGYCGHLIGFYNGGQTFEPRVVQFDSKRKPTGRIIVSHESRQPMKRGYKLVKITTSARVYSPQIVAELVPKKNQHLKGLEDVMQQERELVAFAERIRNPVLEGEWDGSVYDREAEPSPPTA